MIAHTDRRYLRTSGGRVVHKPDCKHLKRALALPWLWADGMTPDEIDEKTRGLGYHYRWCADCFGGPRRLASR